MSASDIRTNIKENLAYMPDLIRDRFGDLLYVQSHSRDEKAITAYIHNYLLSLGVEFEIDAHGNILATKGNAEYYPCIVSHIDTVHQIRKNFKPVYERLNGRDTVFAVGGKKFKEQVGCGGDDKCGVFACMYMLERFDNVKVAFFSREEIGCIGSGLVNKDWFKDVGYIIQLDRWGRNDFINMYYNEMTVSKEYDAIANPIMKKYGYKSEEGLITDSIGLWNKNIGVSCVNVSCGYYQHHTDNEIIDLNEFWNSLLFTHELMQNLGENQYKSKPDVNDYGYRYGGYSGRKYYGYQQYNDDRDDLENWDWDYDEHKWIYAGNKKSSYKGKTWKTYDNTEDDYPTTRLTPSEVENVMFTILDKLCTDLSDYVEEPFVMYDMYSLHANISEKEFNEEVIERVKELIEDYNIWYDTELPRIENWNDLNKWMNKYYMSDYYYGT